ncbi:uncharacterized protein LOC109821227 [Asparagus officinalis]|uniref:uncharacterized protein LOC109821227 n=1 Tax=Asparagus officinalis TaxID=4686 RepID=UPI00098E6408|nr:uncharacterized protein LOC109821227 [Asparagus officinalis]
MGVLREMGRDQLGSIVETIKAKVMGSLKRKAKNEKSKNKNKKGSSSSSSASYVKMDKTASVKVEIQSRHARKLIDKTLMAADQPGKMER